MVGQHTLDQTLAETDRINLAIREILDGTTEAWGVVVTLVELKDIQLPETMKRAMARQAEAEREKRAKIISAEGEALAADQLGAASDVMMAHPLALQLRNLQSLVEIGVDQNTTVVFPAPLIGTIQELGAFLAREQAAGTTPTATPTAPPPVPANSAASASIPTAAVEPSATEVGFNTDYNGAPPPVREVLMPRCPLCRSALVTITFGLYPIAICTSCNARWIQDGRQQRAINQVREPTLFASGRSADPALLAAPTHLHCDCFLRGLAMVIHYPPAASPQQRPADRDHQRPGRHLGVVHSRTGEIPLGTDLLGPQPPRRWALYPNGEEVVVVWPGGA